MPEFNYFAMAYALSALALALVVLYFFSVALVLRLSEPRGVVVAQYEPPQVSPGVAAWLLGRGGLPRAIASALVNMAAKAYIRIEQRGDLYSVIQIGPDVSLDLEPEEDALARTLFKGYDCFDFDDPTPQLRDAVAAFHTALVDTTYFSEHRFLYVPAWLVSGVGAALALGRGDFFANSDRLSAWLLIVTFACFVVAVVTLPSVLQKIASRLPGSVVPKRPWSSSDSTTLTFLVAAIGGLAFLALKSSLIAALLTVSFLVVNTIFFYALQGPTTAGRKAIAQLAEYKKFLGEVDADRISRTGVCDAVPSELAKKHAYAIAFHLDLGWGEQLVDALADVVVRGEVLGRVIKEEAV